MGFGGELAKMLRTRTTRNGVREAKVEIRCRVASSRDFWSEHQESQKPASPHSTVTLFARFRGLSTSVPRAQAVW
jgi:hypothetical protein